MITKSLYKLNEMTLDFTQALYLVASTPTRLGEPLDRAHLSLTMSIGGGGGGVKNKKIIKEKIKIKNKRG